MHRYLEINQNGHNIRCKLYYQDLHAIRRVVVFGHGFGGHKDNRAAEKFAQRLLNKDASAAVLTFNWPAHGDDVKKRITLSDCDAYLELVIDFVRTRFDPEELDAYATSFGGYLVLKYIAGHPNPFRRIALRCPAVNMFDVITNSIISGEDLEKLRKGKEILTGFDRKILIGSAFLEELRTCSVHEWDFLEHAEEILILHGTEDEIVPFESVRAFAENNVIELVPIEGADHRFQNPRKMDQAIKCILDFFSEKTL